MGRVSTAFRAFFGSLFNSTVALRVGQALTNQPPILEAPATQTPKIDEPVRSPSPKPLQSDAITLMATLQREARLVDFLKEDIREYTDEQVGAAVREIHRDCGNVLDRFFEIQPILKNDEGAKIEVPKGFDATRYRLTGKLAGEAPFQGILRHHGWEATRCEIPAYTGSDSATKTIAPAEIELA